MLAQLASMTDSDVGAQIAEVAEQVVRIAPDCVGFSISMMDAGITLTLAASSEHLARLDAMQYLDGGPCIDAAEQATTVEVSDPGQLDEDRWQIYARASAAAGVASSLSMPVYRDGRVIGGVNLYGGSPDAFAGHHDALAGLFTAWAPAAVTNADLTFQTRLDAVQGPARLAEHDALAVATGIVMARHGLGAEAARRRLQAAAAQAGVSEGEVARTIVQTRQA